MRCSVGVLALAAAGRWSWQRGSFDGLSLLVVVGALTLAGGLLVHERALTVRVGGHQ